MNADSPAARTDSPAAETDSPAHGRKSRRAPAAARAKFAPELLSQALLARPRVVARLDEALARRLTIVVADAGWGKSVVLGAWAATVPSVWYSASPDDESLATFVLGIATAFHRRLPALSRELRSVVQPSVGPDGDEADRAGPVATLLCDVLEQELDEDLAVVFDDAHELGRDGPSARLLQELCRQAPPQLHIVLSTRLEPPFPVQRLRGRGEVLDLDAAMLAFDAHEVAELLEVAVDGDAAALAGAVHEITGGWPAAVRLTAEALRAVPAAQRMDALDALHRPGGRLFDYVAEEVFGSSPPTVRQLLRRVAPFPRFNADFCEAIGIAGASESLAALRRAGLFLEARGGEGEWFGLHALVRDFVRERWPLPDAEREEVHGQGAAWFVEHGCIDEALESLFAIGNTEGIAVLLDRHGSELLAAGKVETTLRMAQLLPHSLRSASIEQLAGEAHEIRGDWDEALDCFERAAGEGHALPAALAWRLGLIHHLRGRLDEALEVYERATFDGAAPRDVALLLAWKASAYWLRGDAEACGTSAEQSLARASAAGDDRALAAAHTVLAMLAALAGDRLANDAHYVRALEYAERAGDVLQAVRVRTNRGSRHLEEGEYEQALAELEIATRLADLTGFTVFRALALTNRGEARFRLGRLEEAVADFEASKALYQRAGSRMVCYPLAKLGDVYRERGDTAIAQASYEEAVARAEESGDVQGLVPALAGLAHVLAVDAPARARALADRAMSFGEGMGHVAAALAAGYVALAARRLEVAAEHAERAAAAARLRRDRAGLAQALELAALASPDRDRQVVRLEEAVSLWRGIRSQLGEARAEMLLGLSTGGPDGAARAEEAEKRLRAAGAHGYRTFVAAAMPAASDDARAPLTISTLGRFAVTCGTRPVTHDAWRSKKARDLLKILVARRGRPTPRDVLMEALWPGQDPRRVSNRLSVALSTLRAVVDPERRFPPQHFVAAGTDPIRLVLANVDVDVETFLEQGEEALRLYRLGEIENARLRLEAAEAVYVGDFLEEDLYEDWAAPLREEARALYLAVAAALAEVAEDGGAHDAAIRYRLRILERDRYDERAHIGLVTTLRAGGRHGEARRMYRDYVARMDEIGVEPAPFPNATTRA